jgi:hypothetical protein
MVKRLFKKRIEEIIAKFQGNEILKLSESANYFGLESKGVRQIRGNGVLILTKKKLYFEMWAKPKTIVEIPINSIQKIERAKSHLRKNIIQKLLKVYFVNEKGNLDSVAWMVRDLEEWIQFLENMKQISNS